MPGKKPVIKPIINEEGHILTDFHQGKFSKKDGRIIRSKEQSGPSCVLFSARKFAFFHENRAAVKDSDYYQAYKLLKKMFAQKDIEKNVEAQLEAVEAACKIMRINRKQVIMSSSQFRIAVGGLGLNKDEFESFYENELPLSTKFDILYLELQRLIFPRFGIVPGHWDPKDDGVEGLKKILASYGAVLVAGKYGRRFYEGRPTIESNLSTKDRNVHVFPKSSCKFIGETVASTHAVIVDEVRNVTIGNNSVDMVYFRDPNHLSDPALAEYIYVQSYESFTARMKVWDPDQSQSVYIYHSADEEMLRAMHMYKMLLDISQHVTAVVENQNQEYAAPDLDDDNDEEEEDELIGIAAMGL